MYLSMDGKKKEALFVSGGYQRYACADPEWGVRGSGHPPPPRNFGKNVVIGFVNGASLILHSIYVEYNPD